MYRGGGVRFGNVQGQGGGGRLFIDVPNHVGTVVGNPPPCTLIKYIHLYIVTGRLCALDLYGVYGAPPPPSPPKRKKCRPCCDGSCDPDKTDKKRRKHK